MMQRETQLTFLDSQVLKQPTLLYFFSVQETLYQRCHENQLQGWSAGRVIEGQKCGGRVPRMLPD